MRHPPSASHQGLAEARLAVQPDQVRQGAGPPARHHPRPDQEGRSQEEGRLQERQAQLCRHHRNGQGDRQEHLHRRGSVLRTVDWTEGRLGRRRERRWREEEAGVPRPPG